MRATTRYRQAAYAACITLAMLAGCLWSASHFTGARDAAAQASRDLNAARLTAARIGQLRSRPSGAGSGPLNQTDLHRRGQEALERLGVSGDHLVQIAPDVPRSVGNSAYKEVPSQVTLRDLTLRQIIGFLLAMTGEHSALQVRSLRLHAPQDGPEGARWAAEITLSYLSYEPPMAAKVAALSNRNETR